jgi:hypothetical protein
MMKSIELSVFIGVYLRSIILDIFILWNFISISYKSWVRDLVKKKITVQVFQ